MEAEAEKPKSPAQLWRALKKICRKETHKILKSVSHDTKLWLKHPDGPKPGRGGFVPETGPRSEP